MTFLLIKSLMRAPVNNGNIAHSSFGINGLSHTDSVDKNNSESPSKYFTKWCITKTNVLHCNDNLCGRCINAKLSKEESAPGSDFD